MLNVLVEMEHLTRVRPERSGQFRGEISDKRSNPTETVRIRFPAPTTRYYSSQSTLGFWYI